MEKDKETGAPGCEETGAAARVLRELLRTPAVKDLLSISLGAGSPEMPRELARVLLWEDAALSFGVLGRLPRGINCLVAFLDELGRQLQNIPPRMLREFVFRMAEQIDTESFRALSGAYGPLFDALIREDPSMPGRLINATFDRIGRAASEDPVLLRERTEKKIALLQKALRTTDFGKMRGAVTGRAAIDYPVIESVVKTLVSDPVIFANMLNMAPPLLNNLLKLISTALDNMDFPPEVLAGAVFNLMDEIEAEELAGIINGLSRLTNSLHRGSMLLGRDETRLRPVLQNLVGKTMRGIDEEAAGDALLAVLEDLEVFIRVVSDEAAGNPELVAKGFSVLPQGLNTVTRGLAYAAGSLDRLPPRLYEHLARELEKIEFDRIGNLLGSLVRLANRVFAENPTLVEKALGSTYRSIDQNELRELAALLFRQGAAFAAGEGLGRFLQPEEAAKTLNPLLASYNLKLESEPRAMGDTLSRYLERLDSAELSRALVNTAGGLSQALSENPRLSRSLVKSFFAVLWGAIRGSLRWKKRRKQPARPKKASRNGRQD